MLDVHPPHGKLHGVGDFFLHLFTITVGLLIALGLEDLATRHQKAELRREAESNLQQEIRDNQTGLRKLMPVMDEEQKTLIVLLQFIDAKKAGKPYDISKLGFGFTDTTLSDASWRVAVATGAVALMPYDHAQAYAGAYQLQDEMARLLQVTLDNYLVLEAHAIYGFDPSKVTAAEATADEPEVQRTLAHLVACEQFGASLERVYAKALLVGGRSGE